RAVDLGVGLEALEELLGVVEDGRCRVERERPVRFEPGVVPAPALGVVDRDHVVGEDLPESGIRQYLLALGRGASVAGELHVAAELLTDGHDAGPSLCDSGRHCREAGQSVLPIVSLFGMARGWRKRTGKSARGLL